MSKSTKQPRRGMARVFIALIALVGIPSGAIAFYWLVTFPDVSQLARTNPVTTVLIDSRKAEAREQGRSLTVRWNWVPLSRIAPALMRAVIVAEDASFYKHEGFDWTGIWEAAFHNIDKGKLARGGSTITQQLAKNLYLSSEKTLMRKFHEALIARELERRLSKPRILEIYLNVVEWGNGVYGAEAAARHHFHKSAHSLTLEEAALLAAILPAPREHDPLRMTPTLAKRRKHIMKWMGRRYLQPRRISVD
ncbi:MAG: monofunctional biosynthetic peptidoglycan transglycosylase [Nitrospiraceae bacterium]